MRRGRVFLWNFVTNKRHFLVTGRNKKEIIKKMNIKAPEIIEKIYLDKF